LKAENIDFDEADYVPLPVPSLDDMRNNYELTRQRRLRENEQREQSNQHRQQQQQSLHPSRRLKKGDGNLVVMSGMMGGKGDGMGMMMGMKKGGGDITAGPCDVGEFTNNYVFDVQFSWQSNGFLNVSAGENGIIAMNPSRDTLEYRTYAYTFLTERYGLALDPTDPNPFKTIFGDDGVTPIAVLIAGEAQTIPQLISAGKFDTFYVYFVASS
jgi:hypothetical protein